MRWRRPSMRGRRVRRPEDRGSTRRAWPGEHDPGTGTFAPLPYTRNPIFPGSFPVHSHFVPLLSLRPMTSSWLVSRWARGDGVVGSPGILPVQDFLGAVREQLGDAGFSEVPTLLWLSPGDGML